MGWGGYAAPPKPDSCVDYGAATAWILRGALDPHDTSHTTSVMWQGNQATQSKLDTAGDPRAKITSMPWERYQSARIGTSGSGSLGAALGVGDSGSAAVTDVGATGVGVTVASAVAIGGSGSAVSGN